MFSQNQSLSNISSRVRHLALGRYWILARSLPEDEVSKQPSRPAAWDAESRTKLWRDARAAKAEIELLPCQNITGHVLRYDAQ
jgi:hypothetical protein